MANDKNRRISVFINIFSIKQKIGKTEKTRRLRQYTYVRKEVADYYGLNQAESPKTGAPSNLPVRGSKGAKHFKVPLNNKKTAKGYERYYTVPIPSHMTIKDIREFIKSKFKKNSPKQFISHDGRVHAV